MTRSPEVIGVTKGGHRSASPKAGFGIWSVGEHEPWQL